MVGVWDDAGGPGARGGIGPVAATAALGLYFGRIGLEPGVEFPRAGDGDRLLAIAKPRERSDWGPPPSNHPADGATVTPGRRSDQTKRRTAQGRNHPPKA